ncbi:hypothetical protein KKC17_00225 [Patescibacteria group bacterium]|nr:hypothetical protein [Patescibacteria group bacterium]
MVWPNKNQPPSGVTLLQALLGLALFTVITLSLYDVYLQLTKSVKKNRLVTAATLLATEKMEVVRNLPYQSVGLVNGLPSGSLPADSLDSKDNVIFTVQYNVRNIDDPFDGTIGGLPNDTAPADYKQVTVTVSCSTCLPFFNPVSLTTIVAPKNLENTGNNGALIIKAINASGQPINGALVHITNSTVSPIIDLTDTTDNQGNLLLVDVPPAQESYRIVVSKTGYSTDRTYAPDDPIVINPVKTDATVIAQEVTSLTFAIDLLSQLNISTINSTCEAIANIPFNLQGAKLISQSPAVYKYNQNLTTDTNGLKTLTNLEWDSYLISPTSASYELRGTIPPLPLNLSPASNQNLNLVMQTSTPHSVLLIVKDASTQLPLSGAAVKLTKASWSETILTSRGYLTQTEWKQGPGQENFINSEKYFSDDGHIETSSPAGQLKLKKVGNSYVTDGWLISSTFDAGAAASPATVAWQPGDQPASSGSQPIKIQLASNNDQITWNFVGPDGTANTFYTASNQTIGTQHNGDRYLRYKVYLSTADDKVTPNLSDISLTYASQCIPPGQAFFTKLTSATYDVEISLTNYQTLTTQADLSPNWTSLEISLLPN